MLSLQTIQRLSEQAARRSRLDGALPQVYDAEALERAAEGDLNALRRIPNLGTRCPRGWRRVDLQERGLSDSDHGVYLGDAAGNGAFMVDKSGWGREDEPALTLGQFARCH